MKACIAVSAALLLALPWASAAQELLPGSEKTKYTSVQIAPDKNGIAAVAQLQTGDPAAIAAVAYSLHFFDRAKKTRVELTPKGSVFGSQRVDDQTGVECIVFWADGRGLLVGGFNFFAGWENPTKMAFLRRGDPDPFLERFEVNQIAGAKKGARMALVTTRRLDPLIGGPSVECKLVLWAMGVSKDDIQSVLLNKRYEVPVAKLVAGISGDGNFLACYDKDAKKLTVHDASKVEIKQHAEFDLDLPDVLMFRGRPAICFAHDNSVLWVLNKEKLHPFDLKTKKQGKTVEFKAEPFDMHALADGSYLVLADMDGNGRGRQTFLNLFNPKTRKVERRVGLGKSVARLAFSPDDQLLAGCGADSGIYLWDAPALLAKARKQD